MKTNQFDTYASVLLPAEEQEARRQRMAARQADAKRAMWLYTLDNAAASRGERDAPSINDYTRWTWEDGPRDLEATEYAKSRFNELPAEKPKRKRNVSPEAKARHIARDRSRRRAMA